MHTASRKDMFIYGVLPVESTVVSPYVWGIWPNIPKDTLPETVHSTEPSIYFSNNRG